MGESHTPGPWEWDQFAALSNGDVVIAQAESLPRDSNARLIAAAPDLLAACQYALPIMRDLGLTARVEQIEAAIAKATGSDVNA